MKKGSKSAKVGSAADASPELVAKPTPVLLTKRAPVAPPDPKAPREKICSECGMHFKVESGQKFYLCPDCYRRSFVYKRKGGNDVARILTHIVCATCGAQEYLPFVPDDPAKSLCRACFAKERPEPKSPPRHSHR
jgi:CxxC-x17-CxxC domain-containing protein